MPSSHRPSGRRPQQPGSLGRNGAAPTAAPAKVDKLAPQQILQRYRPGQAPPLEVLEVLLEPRVRIGSGPIVGFRER